MRCGIGVGVVDFGSLGGVSDSADGASLAAAMIEDYFNGLAINFLDMTAVVKVTSGSDELLDGYATGLAIDFVGVNGPSATVRV